MNTKRKTGCVVALTLLCVLHYQLFLFLFFSLSLSLFDWS